MKKFFKEKIGVIIFLVIVIGVVGIGFLSIQKAKENAITYVTDYEAPEGNVDPDDEGKFVSVAKSEHAELFYNSAKGTIQLKNLDNGYLWKGYCDEEEYNLKGVGKKWKAYVQSSVVITYNDLKKRDAAPVKVYSSIDCKWLESELIENGVSVKYGFLKPGIYVTVEYVLDGDELVVRVPHDKIEEYSKYAITMIDILPGFAAASDDVDGYMFYPDGSGAITSFAKADTRPETSNLASFYTYSYKYLSFENYYDPAIYNRYTGTLPVYGIKKDNNALFAAVTEGEAASGVLVYPSGCNNVSFNHINFQLDLRNVFNVDMNSMSTGIDTKATSKGIQRVDKNFIPEDRELRFFMLKDNEADYSGMASIYKRYLLESGRLQDVIDETAEMPLSLQLLCGATKEGLIFRQYVPMTTSDNVKEIIDRLSDDGIDNFEVVLTAWQADANYDNNIWPVASKIGGKSGIKDLSEYAKEKSNVDIFLAQDTTFTYDTTSDFDQTNDVVYNGLGIEVSLEFFDGTFGYLTNAQAIQNRNNKLLKKLKSADALGIAYDTIGKYIYADSNEENPFTKQTMVEKVREILKDTSAAGRKVATAGANSYVFSDTDYVYDLNQESYGLSITDYDVPFVEMLLSGCIPYATGAAGNLSYDLNHQKLKWIEFGATPYFYLTYESALNLKETNYTLLFSSTFDDWEQEVIDVYSDMKANLGDLYGQAIVSHDYLTDDLVRIVYESGAKVYVNYGTTSISRDGVTIPAEDYVVVKGGQ